LVVVDIMIINAVCFKPYSNESVSSELRIQKSKSIFYAMPIADETPANRHVLVYK